LAERPPAKAGFAFGEDIFGKKKGWVGLHGGAALVIKRHG